jgi:D-alanyl-D-alanine dipeptidase
MDISSLLIPDSELRKIPVKENQETLVDLREASPTIICTIAWYIEKNGGKKAFEEAHYVRKSVAEKVNKAQSLLPAGYSLMLDNAYRSPAMQQKSYNNVLIKLKAEQPGLTEEELEAEMSKRVSKVEFASHCTGGALDLTIVDKEGQQLDMGTGLDDFTAATFTLSDVISPEAKKNREMLIQVMTKAGFVNFPAEWWHWSYGDREWAYYQEDKTAIYGPIEIVST